MALYRITRQEPLAGGFFYLSVEAEGLVAEGLVAEGRSTEGRSTEGRSTDRPTAAPRPGSFVMIRCADGTDPYLRRPMCVADFAPDGSRFGLLIQNVGRGTALLADKKIGDRLDIIGPFGKNVFEPAPPGTKLWLVAGGTGAAPFLGYVETIRLADNATIFLGARREELLFFRDRFAAIDKLDVVLATEDGSIGARGFVTVAMEERLAAGEKPDVIYTCGPTPMMRGVAAFAAKVGAACFVSLENRMACGFGACLGCVQKLAGRNDYTTVCKRGPVFDAKEIEL